MYSPNRYGIFKEKEGPLVMAPFFYACAPLLLNAGILRHGRRPPLVVPCSLGCGPKSDGRPMPSDVQPYPGQAADGPFPPASRRPIPRALLIEEDLHLRPVPIPLRRAPFYLFIYYWLTLKG